MTAFVLHICQKIKGTLVSQLMTPLIMLALKKSLTLIDHCLCR